MGLSVFLATEVPLELQGHLFSGVHLTVMCKPGVFKGERQVSEI